MIFRDTWEQVLDRTKTRTRRIVFPNEQLIMFNHDAAVIREIKCSGRSRDKGARLKWVEGREYAIQPARGHKAVGRFKINTIRREFLHDIKVKECFLEGIGLPDWIDQGVTDAHVLAAALFNWDIWNKLMFYGMNEFTKLWDSIYAKSPYSFEKNPEVWVLEIECVDPFGWGNDTKSAHYFTRLPDPIFWSKAGDGKEGYLRYMSRCGNSFAAEDKLERIEMPPGRGCQSCNSLIKHDRNKIRIKLAGEKNE